MARYPTDWRAASACLGADPDVFFPIATGRAGERQAAKAQRICERCRVQRECLEFAMRTGEAHGIWGGTTPEERVRVRRRRRWSGAPARSRPASGRERAGAA